MKLFRSGLAPLTASLRILPTTLSAFSKSPFLHCWASLLSMAACSVCNNFLPNNTNDDIPVLNLDIKFLDLVRSSNGGCQTCSVIREGYESFNSESENHSIRISGNFDSNFPDGLLLWGKVGLRFHVLKGNCSSLCEYFQLINVLV